MKALLTDLSPEAAATVADRDRVRLVLVRRLRFGRYWRAGRTTDPVAVLVMLQPLRGSCVFVDRFE